MVERDIAYWGTRGRRFKSCQPDTRSPRSEDISSGLGLCRCRGGGQFARTTRASCGCSGLLNTRFDLLDAPITSTPHGVLEHIATLVMPGADGTNRHRKRALRRNHGSARVIARVVVRDHAGSVRVARAHRANDPAHLTPLAQYSAPVVDSVGPNATWLSPRSAILPIPERGGRDEGVWVRRWNDGDLMRLVRFERG